MAKTKYEENFPALVEGYAKQGLIEREMALKLGISVTTFEEYKTKIPEFSGAIKRGKEIVDREVEQSLYKRALGYEYEEVKTTTTEGPAGVTTITSKTTKVMAPDVTAMIFWLKNRKPAEWRDAIRLETVDINQALKEAEKLDAAEKRSDAIDTNYSVLDDNPE
ncbi:MAG: hypothetical protein WCI90_07795 [Chlorobium sp.]|nr:MAG: hypothetical protein FDX17_00745 [Chlorobium sp.]